MKNRIRITCCLILLTASAIRTSAQDLTGIWRGHFRSNDEVDRLAGNEYDRYRIDDRYKMEVQIVQTHSHFEAVTFSYKSTEFYGKAAASGSLNVQTKKVLLKEGKLLEVRFASGSVCIMTCFMQYSKLGNDEYLQGTYYSTSVSDSLSGCGKGSIFLHRVAESDFHMEPFLEKREKEMLAHKKEVPPANKPSAGAATTPPPSSVNANKKTAPALPPATVKKTPPKTTTVNKTAAVKKQPVTGHVSEPLVQKKTTQTVPERLSHATDSTIKIAQPTMPVFIPEVLKSRTNELLQTLTVNHSSIELRIYDDGAIDNDTVSVYYDNKLIISRARLSDQPITTHITVEPSDHPHQLVMVAENLGDIPPNTSLLVVMDGEKKYEERIISNEQKNVVINFLYKKVE
jgi:hypothetical protein